MLSDVARLRSLERKKRRAVAKTGWYSDAQKLEAVQVWLLTGSMPQTAAALNININTIEKWRYSKWWKELTEQIKAEGRVKLSGRLQTVISKSLTGLEDRIENGDWIIDREGNLLRRPMLGRDLLRITSDFIDKTHKIEGVTREEATVQAVEDRLKLLADSFADFAKKVRKVEVEDVEPRIQQLPLLGYDTISEEWGDDLDEEDPDTGAAEVPMDEERGKLVLPTPET